MHGPADVELYPEVVPLMRAWKDAGGRILGVTNQGGIALGVANKAKVAAAIHATQRLTGNLFDRISMCIHHPSADDPEMARCWCRKPGAGMIINSANDLSEQHPTEYYPPHMALMVGDMEADRGAAAAASIDFMWAKDWRDLNPDRMTELAQAR